MTGPIYQDKLAATLWPNVSPQKKGAYTLYDNRVNKITNYVTKGGVEKDDEGNVTAYLVFPQTTVEIFLSDDGGALLDLIEENKASIVKSADLIQFFIETDADTFSGKVMHALVGKMHAGEIDYTDVIKSNYPNIASADLDDLLGKALNEPEGFLSALWTFCTEKLAVIPEKMLSTALGISIDIIEELRLSDKWWSGKKQGEAADSKGIEEFIKDVTEFAEKATNKISSLSKDIANKYLKKWKGALARMLKQLGENIDKIADAIKRFKEWVQKLWRDMGMLIRGVTAAICGFWNGLVDMVTGLLFIVKAVLDGSKALREGIAYTANNRERILEEVDNLYQSIGNVSWSEVYEKITEKVKALPSFLDIIDGAVKKMKEAKNKAVNAITGISKAEWAYYIGYGITFFIPVGAVANVLGKAGKAGKTLGKILVWVDKLMAEAFGIVLKAGQPVFNKITALLKNVGDKLRKGTAEIKNLVELIFNKFKEWLEEFIGKIDKGGKIGNLGIIVIDTVEKTVQRITETINNKVTEYYLITYKKTGVRLYCTILPIEVFISTFRDLIKWRIRQNLRQLAKEGFELLEEKGTFYIKYKDEIVKLGDAKKAAKEINALVDKETGEKAKKALDEWVELVKKRRSVLAKWIDKFDRYFKNHLDGELGLFSKEINGKEWEYIEKGQGGHFVEDGSNALRLKTRVPEPPVFDKPYKAQIEVKYKDGVYLEKTEISSMFPENWSFERIQEEVAWVYENTVANGIAPTLIKKKSGIEQFEALATNGMVIRIEVLKGKIINAHPII